MNRFENVCGPCPLRTKVDVGRARETGSFGSDGVQSVLSDGQTRYSVSLARGEVEDSDTVRAIDENTQRRIQGCTGPETTLFRMNCGAGLASSWRWTEERGHMQPNVAGTSEIVPLLTDATRRDAEPHYDRSTYVVGDFSEYDIDYSSSFHNRTINKLTQTVRGTAAELPKGKAVILDSVSGSEYDDVYRIRIPQGGPHFAFRTELREKSQEVDSKAVLAEGVYRFLCATPGELAASTELITEIYRKDEKAQQRMADFFSRENFTGGIFRGLSRENEPGETDSE